MDREIGRESRVERIGRRDARDQVRVDDPEDARSRLEPGTPLPEPRFSTNPVVSEALDQARSESNPNGWSSSESGATSSAPDASRSPSGGPGHSTVVVSHGTPAWWNSTGVPVIGRSSSMDGSNSIWKVARMIWLDSTEVSGRFQVRTRKSDRAS